MKTFLLFWIPVTHSLPAGQVLASLLKPTMVQISTMIDSYAVNAHARLNSISFRPECIAILLLKLFFRVQDILALMNIPTPCYKTKWGWQS